MPINEARSIDDLYAEVEGYDLVLTTDAPLSLALNRRIESPRLGRFAATPRMLASGEFRPEDKRRLFLEAIEQTDYDWKLIDHLIENIIGCWEETGEFDRILAFDAFDTNAAKDILELIRRSKSAHQEVAEYTIDDDLAVAVVGEDHFTALDRTIFPDDYTSIALFKARQTVDLPPFHVFESATAIVDAIVQNIEQHDADDIAIVMDSGGQFPPLIESALAINDIPFHGGPGFAADDGVRTYLRLLQVSTARRAVRIGDLRPVLTYLDLHPRVQDEDKRLTHVDDPELDAVTQFIESVESYTFADAFAFISDHSGEDLTDLHVELGRLGLLAEPITPERVNDLDYYLRSFEVPTDDRQTGVLLADPSANPSVDRPVVFFLGMDESWTQRVPDRPWIDTDARDRQHLEQFELLIQNGQEQYFLVQETVAGEAVTPCLYFHDLLDGDFETFTDLAHMRYSRYPIEDPASFAATGIDIEPSTVELLSQSSLNTFVNCPRDYLFDRLVQEPHREYFTKGNLIHDFAEFCVAHSRFAAELDDTEVVELMLEEYAPFVDDIALDLAKTEFEVAVEVIRGFLTAQPPVAAQYEGYDRDRSTNIFADHYGRPIDSTITEQSFESEIVGVKGKVDLIHEPTRLIDYKTGASQPSTGKLVRQAGTDPVDDEPNFQAPMYLAHHRRQVADSDLEFAFLYVLSVLDDAVTGEMSLDDALVRLPYHPVPFTEYAGTRDAFEELCEGVAESNDRRKTLERLGFESYTAFFEDHDIPDVEAKDAILESEFCDDLIAYAEAHVGEYTYVTNGIESALKTLISIRTTRFFADDLDAIEDFIDEQRSRLNEFRRATFPVGDPNPDRLTNRDMIYFDD